MTVRPLLPAGWEVPPLFRRRLGARVGRQRAMSADGHVLLVLHAPPAAEETERQGRLFWRRPDGAWSSTGLGSGPAALKRHLDEYAALIDRLDDDEEAASGPDEYFEVVRRIIPVRRAAGNLHATLQQAREMLPDARDIIDFRDRAYQISRSADLLHTVAREGLDFEVALHSERLAEHGFRMSLSAHRLNMLAAFFFPLATLSAIFGMNFKHGWEEAAWPQPFIAVIAGGVLFGAVLTVLIARRPSEERALEKARRRAKRQAARAREPRRAERR